MADGPRGERRSGEWQAIRDEISAAMGELRAHLEEGGAVEYDSAGPHLTRLVLQPLARYVTLMRGAGAGAPRVLAALRAIVADSGFAAVRDAAGNPIAELLLRDCVREYYQPSSILAD